MIEYDVMSLLYDTLHAYQGDNCQLLEPEPDIPSMRVSAWQKYELLRDKLINGSPFSPLFRFGKFTPEVFINRLPGECDAEDSVIGSGFLNGPEVMPPGDKGPARVARHQRESPVLHKLPKNEAALKRIVELALSRGLKVVLTHSICEVGVFRAVRSR